MPNQLNSLGNFTTIKIESLGRRYIFEEKDSQGNDISYGVAPNVVVSDNCPALKKGLNTQEIPSGGHSENPVCRTCPVILNHLGKLLTGKVVCLRQYHSSHNVLY